ncbi:hypothetical protein EB001_19970 [bacterium]|jgi:hypothetical protein|nr:hypothetical protein [bacterium]
MKKPYYIVFLNSYNKRHNTDIHYAKSDEDTNLGFFYNKQDAQNFVDHLNEKYKNDKEYRNQYYIYESSYYL